jgi:hypothetical protein
MFQYLLGLPTGTVVSSVKDLLSLVLGILESAKQEIVYLTPASLISLAGNYYTIESARRFIQNGGALRGIMPVSRTNVEEARTALFELDRAVVAANANELYERKDVLQEMWKSANAECEKMFKRKKHLKWGTEAVSLSLGILGPVATSFEGPGIIQTLLSSSSVVSYAVSKGLLDRPIEMLIKATKPSYINALYDLSRAQ